MKAREVNKDKCRGFRELINLAVDGEIDAGRRQALEEHIALCGACARTLDELVRTAGYIERLPREKIPAGFNSTVLEAVRRARAEARALSSRRLYRTAAAAAALTALLNAGGFSIIQGAIVRSALSVPVFLVDVFQSITSYAKTLITILDVGLTLVSALFTLSTYLSEQLFLGQTIIIAATTALVGVYYITRVAARAKGAPASLI